MNPSIAFKAIVYLLAPGLLAVLIPLRLDAAGLNIEEAAQLALKNDYTLQAIEARGRSMSELSVAAQSLPDPKLRVGLANLPTDSFSFSQEPMTQAVIGVQQAFPRGQTRSLKSARLDASIARSEAEAEDRARQVLLAVRRDFTQVFLHQERQKIVAQSIDVFSDLADITRDYYASGRSHQQDVVQAELELSRVRERLVRMRQQEEEARARLAERIGADAWRDLDPQWPQVADPVAMEASIQQLAGHPRLLAWQHEITKARTDEDIARQAYKPGFAVDLAYGGRSGQNMDGSQRSDFLSVFVSMDIPLFTKNRQDRVLASSIEETSATELARHDAYRSMKAQIEELAATLRHERERLSLYEEHLLPQAAFNAETAFQEYQDAVGDLTSLMRARIGEYEIRLDYASLRAEEIITRSRLLYLQGESS
jgi:outer membrane protein TolC